MARTMASIRAWSAPSKSWKAVRAARALRRASRMAARSASSAAAVLVMVSPSGAQAGTGRFGSGLRGGGGGGGGVLAEDHLDLLVRPRDDVDGDDLADLAGGDRTGVGGGLDRADVAADHDGDQPAADLLAPDEADVGGLDHGVGRLDGAHQAPGLHQAEGADGDTVAVGRRRAHRLHLFAGGSLLTPVGGGRRRSGPGAGTGAAPRPAVGPTVAAVRARPFHRDVGDGVGALLRVQVHALL